MAHYISTLNSEEIAGIADRYAPILRGALEDLGYNDFRLAARSLPSIVDGYVREANTVWRSEGGRGDELDSQELVNTLANLDPVGRIGILFCSVAMRYRGAATENALSKTTRRSKKRKAA